MVIKNGLKSKFQCSRIKFVYSLSDDCDYDYHGGIYDGYSGYGGFGGIYSPPIVSLGLSLPLPLPIPIPVPVASYGGIK